MSVRAMHSDPAVLNRRDSKLGIHFMNHADPGLRHEITHLLHFSMDWKKVGQWMPEAIARMGIFLPRNAFRNYPLHSDAVNREEIGSRSTGVTDWKKENERHVQLHLSEIISSWMWLHFLKSVQPTKPPVIGCLSFFFFPPLLSAL